MQDDVTPQNVAKPTNKHSFFISNNDRDAANELLSHVLCGNLDKVIQMVEERPELLFIEATAQEWASGFEKETDAPVHRIVQLSPLQAMAAAGDENMLDLTLRIICGYIDKSTQKYGLVIAVEQLDQLFPNGFSYPESRYDFNKLDKLVTEDEQLITTGIPNGDTITAIEQFRKDFMPGVVKSGYLFNMNELIKALSIYRDYAFEYDYRLGTQCKPLWNKAQLEYFWCNVVGYLERLVTAVFAQRICNGLNTVNDEKGRFERKMTLRFEEKNKTTERGYFPLSADPGQRLGIDIAVASDLDEAYANERSGEDNGLNTRDELDTLVSKCSNKLEVIYRSVVNAIELNNLSIKKN